MLRARGKKEQEAKDEARGAQRDGLIFRSLNHCNRKKLLKGCEQGKGMIGFAFRKQIFFLENAQQTGKSNTRHREIKSQSCYGSWMRDDSSLNSGDESIDEESTIEGSKIFNTNRDWG